MKEDADPKRIRFAIEICTEARLDYNGWRELILRTSCEDTVNLTSQVFEELKLISRYRDWISEAVEKIITRDPNNVGIIEEFTGLEKWLKRNNSRLYKELYENNEGH